MEKQKQFIVFKEDELDLKVTISGEQDEIWLSKQQICELFDVSYKTVDLQIRNIYKENEQEEEKTTKQSMEVHLVENKNSNRLIKFYSLDVIISLAYRIKSKQVIIFRKWASKKVKDYMKQGFVLDRERLIASGKH